MVPAEEPQSWWEGPGVGDPDPAVRDVQWSSYGGEELSRLIQQAPQATPVSKAGTHNNQSSMEFVDTPCSGQRMTPSQISALGSWLEQGGTVLSPGSATRQPCTAGYQLHNPPRGPRCHLLYSWNCQPLSLIHDDHPDELKCAGRSGGSWNVVRRPSQAPGIDAGSRSHPDLLGEALWAWVLGATGFHRLQLIQKHERGPQPWWS